MKIDFMFERFKWIENLFRLQNEDREKVKYFLALIVSSVTISNDISIVRNFHCTVLKHTETKDLIEKGFFLWANVSKVIEMRDGLLFPSFFPSGALKLNRTRFKRGGSLKFSSSNAIFYPVLAIYFNRLFP